MLVIFRRARHQITAVTRVHSHVFSCAFLLRENLLACFFFAIIHPNKCYSMLKFSDGKTATEPDGRIVFEELQSDSSIMIRIMKQYNTNPAGDYGK